MDKDTKYSQCAGTWTSPSMAAPCSGILYHDADSRLLRLKLTMECEEAELGQIRIFTANTIPYIQGRLFSGATVTLLGCSYAGGSSSSGTTSYVEGMVYADFAFWGLDCSASIEPLFRGGVFDFGDWVRWSGLSHTEWTSCENHEASAIVLHTSNSIEATIRDGVKMTVYAVASLPVMRSYDTNVIIEQRSRVSFEYDHVTKWETVCSDVAWFRNFVALGKGVPVNIVEAMYIPQKELAEDNPSSHCGPLDGPGEVSIGCGALSVGFREPHARFYLFTLVDAVSCGALEAWFEKRDLLQPVIDLHSIAYPNRAPSQSTLFLNLMQSLETLHARFYARTKSEYKRRVDAICDTISDPDLRGFLWNSDQEQRKRIILVSRINDLLYAGGARPLEPKFSRFKEYGERLVKARNYYTHYDPRKVSNRFSQEELFFVNYQLRLLIEYHVMILLGFNPERTRCKVVELDNLLRNT